MSIRLPFFALVALVLSFATPALSESPETIDGATTVTVEEAKALFDEGVMFIDLRKPADYAVSHIEDAEPLDIPGAFNKDTLEMLAGPDDPIVFYCYGVDCLRSSMAAADAVKWGYKKVYYFRDGMPEWEKAGYPVASQ